MSPIALSFPFIYVHAHECILTMRKEVFLYLSYVIFPQDSPPFFPLMGTEFDISRMLTLYFTTELLYNQCQLPDAI